MSEDDTRFSLDTGLNDIGFAKVWLKPVPFLDKPSWTIRKRQEHKEKVGELITTIKLDLDHKGREMFRAAKNCYDYLLRSYKGVELSSWMHAFWEAIEHIHIVALQANITNEMLPNIEKQAASPIFIAAAVRNSEVNSEYAGYNDFCKLLLADKTTPSQHGWTLQRRCEFIDCALAVTKAIRSHMTATTTYGKAAQLTLESLYQNDASHDDVSAFWYATILIHGEAQERGRSLAVMPTLLANELVLVFQTVIKKLKAQKDLLHDEQPEHEDEPMKTDELQLNIRKPVVSLEAMTPHDRALCVRAAALTVQFVSETLQKGGTLDNAANVALKVVLNELTDKLELQVLGSEELRKLTVSQKSEIEAIENGFWLAIEDLRQRCSFEKIEHLQPGALDALMADWKFMVEELVTKYIGTLSDAEDEQREEAVERDSLLEAYGVEVDGPLKIVDLEKLEREDRRDVLYAALYTCNCLTMLIEQDAQKMANDIVKDLVKLANGNALRKEMFRDGVALALAELQTWAPCQIKHLSKHSKAELTPMLDEWRKSLYEQAKAYFPRCGSPAHLVRPDGTDGIAALHMADPAAPSFNAADPYGTLKQLGKLATEDELVEKHHLMEAFDKALAARPAKIRVDFDIRTLEIEF